jgi:DNA invertase Pin-like site-specific DNA recombinase
MGSRYSMTLKRVNGAYKDRIRLPADVRLEYQAQFDGPAWEEKFRRPAGIAHIAKETGLTRQTVYRIKGDPAGAEGALVAWGM